jgi:hypothetical protein
MTAARRLCQALLNGPAAPADIRAAEDRLNAALAAAEQGRQEPDGYGKPWTPLPIADAGSAEHRRAVLTVLAPALLLDCAWLARAAQPANAHQAAECHLLALYSLAVGLDDPARSPPLRFRAHLLASGVSVPPLDSPAFFRDPGFPDFALELPALHLALLHRPRTFFPELLGYTLAHVLREPGWWDAPWPEAPAYRRQARALAWSALDAYPQRAAQDGRIRRGWALYRQGYDALARNLGGWLARDQTAEAALAGILEAKRSQAIGYHGRVELRGRSLDQWLAESADDPGPLLDALRASPYVDRACPAQSRWLRAMDFGGPMFGVFEAEERRACLEWIESSAAAPVGAGFSPRPDAAPSRAEARSYRAGLGDAPLAAAGPRGLFAALLRAESPADCPPAADAAIRGVLRRARWLGPFQRGQRRCFAYEPERFRERIEAMHRNEVARYRPLSGPPQVSREYCRWAALQLAPAILADGCWLAGVAAAAESLGEIGRHLFRIYADELGAGRAEWNHPNVYRRLLDSLGLELPPFGSEAFAQSALFLDAAFDIPVYLLAMGLRAERFFPELLGLNLAIELSGLGAGYLRVIDILRRHRIDPAIIQLHLSIDNLASGHAARAREAIVLHLDDARRRAGAEAAEAEWRRVWTGYLSLHTAASGLALRFAARYLRERIGSTAASPHALS